jgi:hypothetical protein
MSAKKYWVDVPVGMHLGSSSNSGGSRGLLFDNKTNRLTGHADLHEVDDDYVGVDDYKSDDGPGHRPLTPEEIEQIAEALVAIATITVIAIEAFNTKALPQIKRWWRSKMAPKLERARKRARKPSITSTEGSTVIVTTERVDVTGITPGEFSRELSVAFDGYRLRMSPAEAHERRRAIQLAEAFIAEQRGMLASSEIDLRDYFSGLNDLAAGIAQQQVTKNVRVMLEAGSPVEEEIVQVATGRHTETS